MDHLKKLKARVRDAKKQYREGGITPDEQHFLVSIAQDKYHRASVADEFVCRCVDNLKTKILEVGND